MLLATQPRLLTILVISTLVLGGCIPTPPWSRSAWNAQQKERLDKATSANNVDEIRTICIKPFFYNEGFFLKWTAEESQKNACAELRRRFDASLATTTQKAHEAGGLECLKIVDTFFTSTAYKPEWSTEWEKDEARRALISPIAEPCIASMEGLAKDGKHGALYLTVGTRAKSMGGPGLTAAQNERLKAFAKDLCTNAAAEYEAAALRWKDEPLTAALYLAAHARVAKDAGDSAGAEKKIAEARQAVDRANFQDRLTIALSGEGLAAPVVDSVQSRTFSAGITLAKNGEIPIRVQLEAPTMDTGKRSVTLSASYKVEKGTRTNPEWTQTEKDCKSAKHWHDEAVWSCNKNGPRNVNCKRIGELKGKMDACERKLTRTRRDVPAFANENVDYEGLQYFGTASGKLVIREGTLPPETLNVSAAIERTKHGAVPRANVSAQSASPIDEAELKERYLSNAAGLVDTHLRGIAARRANGLLESARNATAANVMTADLVRYALLTKQTPNSAVGSAIGRKLDLPVMEALEMLLSGKK
jgi:hypothetical protein